MKSIRSKIIILYIAFTVIIVCALLGVSIYSIHTINDRDSEQLLEHIGRENAANINKTFENIENAVGNVEYYAYDQLDQLFGRLYSESFREGYLENVSLLAVNQAIGEEYVLGVYYRLTTDVQEEPIGFGYKIDRATGEYYEDMESIIVEGQATDDLDFYGWYYLPKEAKEPVWIGPYDSAEYGTRIMSYCYPVYVHGRFAGVICMDIDIDAMCDELSEITVYNTGSAVMFDIEGNLLYDEAYAEGLNKADFTDEEATILYATQLSMESGASIDYLSDNGVMKLYANELVNGMTLSVIAPLDEINKTQHNMTVISVIVGVGIALLALVILTLLLRSFLRPLQELAEASEKLAKGDFEVRAEAKSNDEIGQLSKTFNLMADSLKKYFDHFHSLAYTDALTGLNNKAAYEIRRDVIESEIAMGVGKYAVIVMDVNNLKVINDTLGHEKGDILLKHVSECMRKTFVGYPLYRIGGDEFCTIISSSENADILIEKLQATTAERSEEDASLFDGVRYQVAAGAAIFDSRIDSGVDETFNRADAAMYENKKYLKGLA